MKWQDEITSYGPAPDPRNTLANERTYLAALRTSLTLLAGGFSVEAFAGDVIADYIRVPVAGVLLVLGGFVAVFAFVRWRSVEIAMRRGDDINVGGLAPWASAIIGIVAIMLLLAIVTL